MIPTKWDFRFLDLARLVASWSKDPSTKTGAVLVRPDRTICSVGFNGFPRGMSDDPAVLADRKAKYSRIVHCEVNAFIHAHETVRGYTLYTWPFLSCDRCFQQLAQAGITRFVAPKTFKAERWEPVFKLVRFYAKEMNITIDEIDYDE